MVLVSAEVVLSRKDDVDVNGGWKIGEPCVQCPSFPVLGLQLNIQGAICRPYQNLCFDRSHYQTHREDIFAHIIPVTSYSKERQGGFEVAASGSIPLY